MDLDTLIADAGPEKVERHRQPSMGLDTAELTLSRLIGEGQTHAAEDDGEATRDEPYSAALRQVLKRPPAAETRRAKVDKLPEIPSPFAILSSGETSAPPAMAPPISVSPTSTPSAQPAAASPPHIARVDIAAAIADEQADPSSFGPEHPGERSSIERMALLRPPSTAPAAVSDPPPEKTSTRAAMGALFDADDSGPGLVLFDDAFSGDGEGFGPQPGTDPDIAPVPDETQQKAESAPEPQLAGAEDPWEGNPGGAPFGFQAGGPTVVDRAILTPEERQRVTFNSDSPPDPAGSLSEKVVISSVRKLFRR